MHPHLPKLELMLQPALTAAERGVAELHATLEALPAPIYTTDASGVVTFFNAACIAFSGRQPEVGKDKWCVTWKLYTESGEFLPHDECPMAVALAAARPVRGVTAVAERPDGVRVTFVPLPTPILDGSGQLIGAANLLLDITEVRQIADLRSQAQRARRLLAGLSDPVSINALTSMSEDYEAKARDLEATMSLALP